MRLVLISSTQSCKGKHIGSGKQSLKLKDVSPPPGKLTAIDRTPIRVPYAAAAEANGTLQSLIAVFDVLFQIPALKLFKVFEIVD